MSALRQVTDSTSSYDLPPAQESKDSESFPLQTLVEEQQTALNTMDHLFDAMSEPNRAMQLEHAKMASAFQRFMEKAEKQLETQSQQIADLKEELAKERAYSASLEETNQSLIKKVDQLGAEMRAAFAAQSEKNLALQELVNASVKTVTDRVVVIEKRFNGHQHYIPAVWYSNLGTIGGQNSQGPSQ